MHLSFRREKKKQKWGPFVMQTRVPIFEKKKKKGDEDDKKKKVRKINKNISTEGKKKTSRGGSRNTSGIRVAFRRDEKKYGAEIVPQSDCD